MQVRSIVFVGVVFLQGLIFWGCSNSVKETKAVLFSELSSDSTGIEFRNDLTFSSSFNIFTYRNFYNGGGVGIGDINNDGLPDIYFTSNQGQNKLYLNKGNFRFEDISERAGVSGTKAWSTGVSMADVNGDGYTDIYVCNSGDIKGDNKQNELFINNGDLTFTEKAEEYGVADKGFTTHAAFFDYDNDHDLDLYILNNSYQAIGSFNLRKNERGKRNELGGDKLFRNDNNRFTDVSEEAGIYGSTIGFGLGVTIGDINKDGWQDIFVSNDFFERDYLYINNQNGTFKECLPEYMKSISGASMGADLADINNDSWPDIFVTEMLPKDPQRLKTVTTFEDWNRYQYSVENDYYHQYTRNMLQLNNGDGTFSEIGRLAGVEATDWSWGALMFDMDNDGMKDIMVANGIFQDLTNQDFLQYASNEEFIKSVLDKNSVDYKKLTEIIPSNPIPNFAFHNEGNLVFKDVAAEWGLGKPGFSNGSAYGDLDNDGDLDLVVNNVNMPSFVYRNNTDKLLPNNHFIKVILQGTGKNTQALGTRINAYAGGKQFYLEQMPMRGFESTVDARPNIGLGNVTHLDSLIVSWPGGILTKLINIPVDTILVLKQDQSIPLQPSEVIIKKPATLLSEVKSNQGINFIHKENSFVDFDRDFLIYHMLSTEGPRMSKGDVNGDGLDDFYIGGAKDQAGVLFKQNSNGTFTTINTEIFSADKISEDMGSTFFDADNDGDQDLFVCSGGNEFSTSSSALQDRLYFNDGKGNFSNPTRIGGNESSSVVKPSDFDNDGDIDLFVGTRLKPFSYGLPMNGIIWRNDGKGNFVNVTSEVAPELLKTGMITDGLWADVDGDKDDDLLVVGEYMEIFLFTNTNGKLVKAEKESGLVGTNGWWNRIKAADLDNDGDVDFVVGNHGLNSRFRTSAENPLSLFVHDFDGNGTMEHIITTYEGDKNYPMVLRHDLVVQIPSLKKKYLKYENYKDQEITDIFTPEQLKGALKLNATNFSSVLLINNGSGSFTIQPLPVQAQFAPVYGMEIFDFNGDNHLDIILGGNQYKVKPQAGRYDASYSQVFIGNGKGQFTFVPSVTSGVLVQGEVRDMITLRTTAGNLLVVSRNNDSVITYTIKM